MKKYVAEFFGTMLLSLTVTASIFSAAGMPTAFWVAMTLALMVFVIGTVSGGHYNPAVTFAMMATKKISARTGLGYIVVQVAAGFAVLGITIALGLKLPAFVSSFSIGTSVAEIIGMAIFAFGIAGAVDRAHGQLQTAIVIGLSLMMGAYIAGGIGSYGIINPAIAISVHIWSLPYLIAPLIGSVIGVVLYRFIGKNK